MFISPFVVMNLWNDLGWYTLGFIPICAVYGFLNQEYRMKLLRNSVYK